MLKKEMGRKMSKINSVIIENDQKSIKKLKEAMEEEETIEIIAAAENGKEGLEKVKEVNPDVVVMELLLSEIDGFAVIDEIKKYNKDIKIILTSFINQQEIVREAFDRGVDYFVIKPYKIEAIISRIKYLKNREIEFSESESYSVDSLISNYLIQIGMPASLKGYRYVAAGIKKVTEDHGVLEGVTKILYPDIARIYDSTPQRVEKAIRHAIEVTWNKDNDCDLKNRFNTNLNSGKKRPTNSEFIATMSQYVMNAYR